MKLKNYVIARLGRWLMFIEGKYLKYLIIYTVVSFLLTLGYITLSNFLPAGLDLNPQMPTESAATGDPFFLVAVCLLPLTLVFEDLGLRYAPWLFIHDIYRLDTIEVKPNKDKTDWEIADKRKWRVWIFHNTGMLYLVVSSLFHSLLHQLNIVSAAPLGRLAYFGVQFMIGYMLALIFLKRGFWESFTVHLSYDLLLIASIVLSSGWKIF